MNLLNILFFPLDQVLHPGKISDSLPRVILSERATYTATKLSNTRKSVRPMTIVQQANALKNVAQKLSKDCLIVKSYLKGLV